MSGNEKSYSRYLGDWILYSGATCNMTPQVSDFIPVSLEGKDKYIGLADGHCVTAKQKGQVQIRMCNDNRNLFIATLHNVNLTPDLCNRKVLIITLMNLVQTCLFNKSFCTVYFGNKREMRLLYHILYRGNIHFW